MRNLTPRVNFRNKAPRLSFSNRRNYPSEGEMSGKHLSTSVSVDSYACPIATMHCRPVNCPREQARLPNPRFHREEHPSTGFSALGDSRHTFFKLSAATEHFYSGVPELGPSTSCMPAIRA